MKRGQHPVSVVFVLIVTVLVLMIAVTLTISLRDFFRPAQEATPCAAEIASHAAIVKYTGGVAKPKIQCPTKVVAVASDDEEEVKKTIADAMASCWSSWGKGTYELFGRDANGQEIEGVYCHVCSVINVSGLSKVTRFPQYLDEHKVSRDQTYAQFLADAKTGTYFSGKEFVQKTADGELRTDKPVAVIFVHTKGLSGYQRLYNGIFGDPVDSTVAGVTVGAAAGLGAVYVIGAVATATGIGAPLGLGIVSSTIVLGGTTVGAGSGLALSFLGTAKPDKTNASVIMVRPLDERISLIGCQYDPVSN